MTLLEIVTIIAATLAVAIVFLVAQALHLRDQVSLLRASCARKNRRINYLLDRLRILEETRAPGRLHVIRGGQRVETK